MKVRILLCCLALGALALVAALVVGLRSQDVTTSARAQGEPFMQLDMDPNNGSGPCNPVDDSVTVGQGSEYDVAVCLTDSTDSPNSFEFHIDHNDSVDQCVPEDCPDKNCLDSNPDANAGTTTFGQSLGTGWDCFVMDVAPPSCSDTLGQISLACIAATTPGTLPAGPGVSAPVGIIHFKAASQGTDKLSIAVATAADWETAEIFDCDQDSGSCRGGTVVVGPPSPESPTPVPTAALTPAPGVTPPTVAPGEATGIAAAEAPAATAAAAAAATAVAQGTPITSVNATATAVSAATKAAAATKATAGGTPTPKPSTTQQKTSGSSGPNAGLIAGIVIVALIVVGVAGWFTFRKLRARKA